MKHVGKFVRADKYPLSQIARRSLVIAVVIGITLTLLNQSDALFGAARLNRLQLALVFITPFLVVFVSQYFGIREARKLSPRTAFEPQGFAKVFFSHGIVFRAIVLGLAAGLVNAGLTAIATLSAGQSLDQLPVAVIAQAVVLPIVFGALSQTISFRRTLRSSA